MPLADVNVILCTCFDPSGLVFLCQHLSFIGGDLSKVPVRHEIHNEKVFASTRARHVKHTSAEGHSSSRL